MTFAEEGGDTRENSGGAPTSQPARQQLIAALDPSCAAPTGPGERWNQGRKGWSVWGGGSEEYKQRELGFTRALIPFTIKRMHDGLLEVTCFTYLVSLRLWGL